MRIAPQFLIYGPPTPAASQPGGPPADADGPAMLHAESLLLLALQRLVYADSDAAWLEAVTARNAALRTLIAAFSDMPANSREIVMTRATQSVICEHVSAASNTILTEDGVHRASSE